MSELKESKRMKIIALHDSGAYSDEKSLSFWVSGLTGPTCFAPNHSILGGYEIGIVILWQY